MKKSQNQGVMHFFYKNQVILSAEDFITVLFNGVLLFYLCTTISKYQYTIKFIIDIT